MPPSSSKKKLDPIIPVALAWKQEATQHIGYRPCSQFLSVMGPASFSWPCLYCQRSLQLKLTLEQRLPGCPVSLCARSRCRSALETVMYVAHRSAWGCFCLVSPAPQVLVAFSITSQDQNLMAKACVLMLMVA